MVNSKLLVLLLVDTGAMSFGDINLEDSIISELVKEIERMYHLLAERRYKTKRSLSSTS